MSETVISCSTLIKNIIKKTFQLSGREPKESILVYSLFVLVAEIIIIGLSYFFQIIKLAISYVLQQFYQKRSLEFQHSD